MTARRPILVHQVEAAPFSDDVGNFWFTVSFGNGQGGLKSKMYRDRWRAKRAARAFIAAIGDAPVTFSYYEGVTPMQQSEAAALGRKPRGKFAYVVERIRHRGTTEPIITRYQ